MPDFETPEQYIDRLRELGHLRLDIEGCKALYRDHKRPWLLMNWRKLKTPAQEAAIRDRNRRDLARRCIRRRLPNDVFGFPVVDVIVGPVVDDLESSRGGGLVVDDPVDVVGRNDSAPLNDSSSILDDGQNMIYYDPETISPRLVAELGEFITTRRGNGVILDGRNVNVRRGGGGSGSVGSWRDLDGWSVLG
jgi:hypothetical protein